MNEESQTPGTNATARSLAARRYGVAVRGRFELIGELGSGSSGTVHHARVVEPYRELGPGLEVAIKFLRIDLPADERALGRFRSEGELGRKLRHRNLAAIHGIETVATPDGEVTFLVMEYVAGTTLRTFLASGRRPVEDLTRRIGADAAAGLHALHKKGLVHRDVKPENLILTPDSQIKIVDLGLVRPFGAGGRGSGSAGTSGFGIAGSVAYAAPESLRGEAAGPRSDLYSLGVVLFELTTGRHPFGDCRSTDEMIDAHLHREPPPPSHLRPSASPFLSQLIRDLLAKDKDHRPRDAADLHRTLAQGEQSEYWRRLEAQEPVRASGRRLLRMRRPADTPFFGRDEQLATLERAIRSARNGRGGVLQITGPYGSGRRRLCDHACERWLRDSVPPLLLGGEADRGLGHGEPFASSLLDLLLRGDDRDSPGAEARASAAAKAMFRLDDADARSLAAVALGTSSEPPEVRADRLASALLQLPSRDRPLLVRVDHADQLDTSGRLVLQRLAANARDTHLLLLLTAEGDAVDGALHIELGGLDEADFLAFGRALFRAGEVSDGFLLTAHQTFGGVPGHLLEALDHLVQDGQLYGRAGDYTGLPPDVELAPAPGHLARLERRIASLDPEQRAVLSAAAVLGGRCQLADLVSLTRLPELAVLETLSLFRGRIVRAQGGEVWFRHRDFAQVLLDATPPERRQQLHREAATIMAQRNRGPLEVGLQLSQALDHQGALDPLLDGLERLVRSSSRRTALRIAGRIAAHLTHVDDSDSNQRRRLRLLLLQAEAQVNSGQSAPAVRYYREAETLARRLDDIEASAAARTGIAALELQNGHLLAAVALLEGVHEDLARLHTTSADRLAARAHGLHGRILLYRGQAVDGHRHLQSALRLLDSDEHESRSHLLIDLARLEGLQHHYPTALKTLAEVSKNPAARRLPRVMLRLLLYRGQVRAVLGDDEAAQDLRLAIAEAERLSLPAYGGRAELFLGERQFWRSHDEEASAHFRRARALAVAGGDRLGEAMARIYLLRLGADDPELLGLVEHLALPSVMVNWLLSVAARGELADDPRTLLDALVSEADLPLSQHLRALQLAERPASARSLVRTIAERIPERRARRRFLALWPSGARI